MALAEAGHTQIAVAWSGNADGGARTCKEVEAAGATSLGVAVDVSDPASVESAFKQVEAAFGPARGARQQRRHHRATAC